jgi:hypothetical protein
MELTMPSIQEEMSKVLDEWNQPEPEPTENKPMPKQIFHVTNNVCRETFNHVKTNPGCTATEAGTALLSKGFKPASVTSLMAQMAIQGMLRRDKFKYYAVANEYTPLKSKKAWAKHNQSGIAALPKTKSVAVKQESTKQEIVKPTAQSLIETLTLREARDLYNELGKYFGK